MCFPEDRRGDGDGGAGTGERLQRIVLKVGPADSGDHEVLSWTQEALNVFCNKTSFAFFHSPYVSSDVFQWLQIV